MYHQFRQFKINGILKINNLKQKTTYLYKKSANITTKTTKLKYKKLNFIAKLKKNGPFFLEHHLDFFNYLRIIK